MPVRKVSNRGGNVVGRFPSMKMGRMIVFESLLERDFIYLLDYDIRVEWFEEQPLTIEYRQDDQALHYTPDFHLVETGRPVLVECKPEHFVDMADNQRKFAVAREWCAARGWEFRVVTDCQIRAGFRLHNIKRLTQYARLAMDPILRSQIDTWLQTSSTPPALQDIANGLRPDDPKAVMSGLLHLAFHHLIELPLDTAPLSGAMVVSGRTAKCQVVES